MTNEKAIVHTLDFFTPIIDDPFLFGQIAGANSLSDIYAMGAEVLFALNICSFPPNLSDQSIKAILSGGAQKVKEAQGLILGGHTIKTNELIYGLSVIGEVHPQKYLQKQNLKVGDQLFLTKPLGTGIIMLALKKGLLSFNDIQEVLHSMTLLNKNASLMARALRSSCCTDITGFSFLGHAFEMVSDHTLHFDFSSIPIFDKTLEYSQQKCYPGALKSNREKYLPHIFFDENISIDEQNILFNPETSGGLLFSVSPEKTHLIPALQEKYELILSPVGQVIPYQKNKIWISKK